MVAHPVYAATEGSVFAPECSIGAEQAGSCSMRSVWQFVDEMPADIIGALGSREANMTVTAAKVSGDHDGLGDVTQ